MPTTNPIDATSAAPVTGALAAVATGPPIGVAPGADFVVALDLELDGAAPRPLILTVEAAAPLQLADEGRCRAIVKPGEARRTWVRVRLPAGTPPGHHPVRLAVRAPGGVTLRRSTTVELLPPDVIDLRPADSAPPTFDDGGEGRAHVQDVDAGGVAPTPRSPEPPDDVIDLRGPVEVFDVRLPVHEVGFRGPLHDVDRREPAAVVGVRDAVPAAAVGEPVEAVEGGPGDEVGERRRPVDEFAALRASGEAPAPTAGRVHLGRLMVAIGLVLMVVAVAGLLRS